MPGRRSFSDITNPFFPELAKGFEGGGGSGGQEVMILRNTDYNPKRMAGCIRLHRGTQGRRGAT